MDNFSQGQPESQHAGLVYFLGNQVPTHHPHPTGKVRGTFFIPEDHTFQQGVLSEQENASQPRNISHWEILPILEMIANRKELPTWETLPNLTTLHNLEIFNRGKHFPSGKCFQTRKRLPTGKTDSRLEMLPTWETIHSWKHTLLGNPS